ncbi:DNA-directed RNA polymerase subunit alpha [Spiroplasma turonicum]|uniref:DNA-directed RNA polymerase subunit alpha n=1 Tax=Spiroplasma turonicum TaxID=216946 RepID=A0A0K1P7S1_9MOLU|nr:DNA-directed RNA polymerase subunit alpha [Spiroplasma turonicum]AKU80244.1 DNA-directed RNA polymerase subunit alpha [Spiroplasma turonicum]ALX71244.1 DNA-directed RNA polymerase subunit alpha [Spiroplasma turonicum]
MKQFSRPEFKLLKEEKSKNYGEFQVEPLERGFGITLGNALRRTLISSTPGAAVYAIKLDKAAHEFTSIEGIVENVSRIILNIKKLAIKIDTKIFEDDEVVELKLKSSTVGELTAGDIEVPTGVEVVNKDLKLCTIADGGSINLIMFAKNSRGYRTFKDNKKEKMLLADAITIDSNYSPILNVAYDVETTKIGKSVDLEKLVMKVETNGTLSVGDAVATAAKILVEHLEFFVNLNEEISDIKVIGATSEEDEKELDKIVEDLDFTQRSLNCLKRANINTLRDLVSKSEDDIQEIRNLGRKSLKEIKDKVVQLGLTFRQD